MRVLDLFSGIGGFALGLESVGMQTIAFCEQDGYARRILRGHWPNAWLYEDVRTLTAKRLKADDILPIDLICGGFPCQDISCAGKGAGIEGERSGLWSEFARIIREIKPRWVIAENVPALRCRGADRVLGDLETAGYSAWPLVVGALHAGAPHKRQRVWIVAHDADGRSANSRSEIPEKQNSLGSRNGSVLPHAMQQRHDEVSFRWNSIAEYGRSPQSGLPSDADERKQIKREITDTSRRPQSARRCKAIPHAESQRCQESGKLRSQESAQRPGGWWCVEPDVGRVAHGVPARVDRLRCLGNAVVPQVVAMIGQAILDADVTKGKAIAG